DIVRKTLGQHKIATVQTTAVDQALGIVNLTTTLKGSWWQNTGSDPLVAARALWLETHPLRDWNRPPPETKLCPTRGPLLAARQLLGQPRNLKAKPTEEGTSRDLASAA